MRSLAFPCEQVVGLRALNDLELGSGVPKMLGVATAVD